jgi:Uma2 family endonuclease
MATYPQPLISEDQLLSLPHIGKSELIDGRIIMSPAGYEHGVICSALHFELTKFVRPRKLGQVVDSSTGFVMVGGNVLSPDVGFIVAERLRNMPRPTRRYFRGAPDLAAEVLSPNDPPSEMQVKVADYLSSGARLVWVINPASRCVRVHRGVDDATDLPPDASLDGDEVVPGFSMSLSDLFTAERFD